jgi:hypothetical protein
MQVIVGMTGIDGNRKATSLQIAQSGSVPFLFIFRIIDSLVQLIQFHLFSSFPVKNADFNAFSSVFIILPVI